MRVPPRPEVLRLGRILDRSRANGPGERAVIWVQGCSLRCPGCYNPEFFAAGSGEALPVDRLAERVLAVPGLRGVTLSGGEPLQQPEAVRALLRILRPRLDAVLFTGYTLAEIASDPLRASVLENVDLVVAGRYERALTSDANLWAGSENKAVVALTGRIRTDEFPDCRVEAVIGPDGSATLTGFPPAELKRALQARG